MHKEQRIDMEYFGAITMEGIDGKTLTMEKDTIPSDMQMAVINEYAKAIGKEGWTLNGEKLGFIEEEPSHEAPTGSYLSNHEQESDERGRGEPQPQ